MKQLNLFMIYLGCKPSAPKRSWFMRWILKKVFTITETSRNTEQHDTMFAVGETIADCKQQILNFWPNANGLHIDGYVQVTHIQNIEIVVKPGHQVCYGVGGLEPFFANLGTYTEGVLDEQHKKLLLLATDLAKVSAIAKKDPLFNGTRVGGGAPHVDDKFGFDDVFRVNDALHGYHLELGNHVPDAPPLQVVILGFKRVKDL